MFLGNIKENMSLKTVETLKRDCWLQKSNYRLFFIDLEVDPLAIRMLQADYFLLKNAEVFQILKYWYMHS